MQPEIVSVGEPMLEFNALEEGSLSEVTRFEVGWGGDTSNFLIAVSRLGGRAGYVTRLGGDEFGDSFMALWKREGVDTSRVLRDPEAPTGIYFISRRAKKHFFTYYRKGSAASAMTPDFLPVDYIKKAKLLHVSGISQGISASACDTVFAAVRTAREAGVKVSYDPNLRLKLWPLERARAIIHGTMSLADIALPSLDDAVALTGLKDPEEIAAFYLKTGPQAVVLKMGGEGALLATRSRTGAGDVQVDRFDPARVHSVDMAGAGDTFDGAFAVGYVAGWALTDCVRFANAAAALTTTGLGCVSPIPRREDVDRLLAQRTT